MKINVIGLGYIGLPTALMLAANGMDVAGSDKKSGLLSSLRAGKLTFEERGMPEVFEKARANGIEFFNAPVRADVYIIAVPTPYDPRTKLIDHSYVDAAVSEALDAAPRGAIIAVESTIAPGTMDGVREAALKRGLKCGSDFFLAHVPERIIPGNMLAELRRNNRTIGADDPATGETLRRVYSSFCEGTLTLTSVKVAEMTKVMENTARDVQIAFANELAKICHKEGVDPYEVIRICNMHPRVHILNPGPGVGGHCISVDPWFLVGEYPEIADLITAARRVNDSQPEYVLKRIRDIMKEHDVGGLSRVGLYGLTYKENVDDTRESPTLQLLSLLPEKAAARLRVYDPLAAPGGAAWRVDDFDEFLDGLELVVVLVAHDHLLANADRLADKLVFDTRNCLTGDNVIKL